MHFLFIRDDQSHSAMRLKPIMQRPIPNSDQIDKFFDADQRRAIAAALDDGRQFVVIRGPRGSGKNLIAAEMINKVIFLKLPKMREFRKDGQMDNKPFVEDNGCGGGNIARKFISFFKL